MSEEQTTQIDQTAATDLGISVFFCLLFAIFAQETEIKGIMYNPGIIVRILSVIVGVPGCVLGLRLGRWIRNTLQPDMVFYNSTMDLAKTKLFWVFVPPTVGILFGYTISAGVIFYIGSIW